MIDRIFKVSAMTEHFLSNVGALTKSTSKRGPAGKVLKMCLILSHVSYARKLKKVSRVVFYIILRGQEGLTPTDKIWENRETRVLSAETSIQQNSLNYIAKRRSLQGIVCRSGQWGQYYLVHPRVYLNRGERKRSR